MIIVQNYCSYQYQKLFRILTLRHLNAAEANQSAELQPEIEVLCQRICFSLLLLILVASAMATLPVYNHGRAPNNSCTSTIKLPAFFCMMNTKEGLGE